MAVQLLFCGVVLPGFVQNSSKHSCVAFSQCVLLASMWCIHTIVLTQPQLGRNHLILLARSDFYMVDNLSIAVHAFIKCMLTTLLVDEILLPRYVNLSTNFRGLPPASLQWGKTPPTNVLNKTLNQLIESLQF